MNYSWETWALVCFLGYLLIFIVKEVIYAK